MPTPTPPPTPPTTTSPTSLTSLLDEVSELEEEMKRLLVRISDELVVIGEVRNIDLTNLTIFFIFHRFCVLVVSDPDDKEIL